MFCLIVRGESVTIRGGMEATFKNKNHVFIDREAGEIIRFLASVCPSVSVRSYA